MRLVRLYALVLGVAAVRMAFEAVALAQTQPITKTISINVFVNSENSCGYNTGQLDFPFTDTAGGDWTKLEVRMNLAYFQFHSPPTFSIAINGVPVGDAVQVTNAGSETCGNRQLYVFQSGKLQNYRPLTGNTFTIVSSGGGTGGDTAAQLTFTTPVPTFEFEYVPASTNARMLIHNYSPQGTLPAYQIEQGTSGRPRFRFPGVVKADGVGIARDVWFRVVDPKDSAPYGTPAVNDNQDPSPKGFLTTAGCADPACRAAGGNALKVRSSASGAAEVILEGTDRYGGDNYLIEASFNAQFTCATSGPNGSNICAKSGIVTAWKRINVEVHKMFVRGAFLTEPVLPGDTIIPISNVEVFPDPPFVVRLIHGADTDGGSPFDFYHEDVVVQHLEGGVRFRSPDPGLLFLRHPNNPTVGDTIQGQYDGPEAVDNRVRPYLADAVGLSAATSDYMTVDTSLVAPLFDDAFVEFLWLTDEAGTGWPDPRYSRVIPFVDQLEFRDGAMTELLARKWMRNAQRSGVWRIAEPNHQMVFLASRAYGSPGEINRGTTRVSHAFNDLWLYTAATPNTDLRAEALTHELGHEWLVNQSYLNGQPTTLENYPGGHCDLAFGMPQHIGIAADAAHLCEMTSGNNMWTTAEARDRRVGFHYVTQPGQQIDSEYLHIRRRAEPVPQNDNPRPRVITQ